MTATSKRAGHSEAQSIPALVSIASIITVAFMGSVIVAPPYTLYQRKFGFSEVTLTLIYAVYVVGKLNRPGRKRPKFASTNSTNRVAKYSRLGVESNTCLSQSISPCFLRPSGCQTARWTRAPWPVGLPRWPDISQPSTTSRG
ncbi:MAG: hypothetical protein ACRDP1_16285 [Nocardioidaceae bacterium]